MTLFFKRDLERGIPAITSGQNVCINAEWINENPDDIGLVIHEMVHVIQAYPQPEPWWITEGIADYIRYHRFEPSKPRRRIDPKTANWRDSYDTAAEFLAWIEKHCNTEIICKLNKAMRESAYKDELFETYTGKSLNALWCEFISSFY